MDTNGSLPVNMDIDAIGDTNNSANTSAPLNGDGSNSIPKSGTQPVPIPNFNTVGDIATAKFAASLNSQNSFASTTSTTTTTTAATTSYATVPSSLYNDGLFKNLKRPADVISEPEDNSISHPTRISDCSEDEQGFTTVKQRKKRSKKEVKVAANSSASLSHIAGPSNVAKATKNSTATAPKPRIRRVPNSTIVHTSAVPRATPQPSDNEEEELAEPNVPKTKKNRKIPAIVITQSVTADNLNLLTAANIIYNFKFFPKSVHIYTYSEEDHAKAAEIIRTFAVGFTRSIRKAKPLQVLARGMPNIQKSEMIEAITSAGLTPLDVRLVREAGHTAIVAIDFDAEKMSLEKLKKDHRSIMGALITWESSKRSARNPPICYRCSMWDHASIGCFRPPVCVLCADAHVRDNCPLNDMAVEQRKYRCVNCHLKKRPDSHHAQDDCCPTKIALLAKRKKSSAKSKNATAHSPDEKPYTPAVRRNVRITPVTNVPLSPQGRTQSNTHSILSSPSYANALRSGSAVTSTPPPWEWPQQANAPPHATPNNNNIATSPLPAGPLLGQMFHVLRQLSSCSTRQEQFAILESVFSQWIQ